MPCWCGYITVGYETQLFNAPHDAALSPNMIFMWRVILYHNSRLAAGPNKPAQFMEGCFGNNGSESSSICTAVNAGSPQQLACSQNAYLSEKLLFSVEKRHLLNISICWCFLPGLQDLGCFSKCIEMSHSACYIHWLPWHLNRFERTRMIHHNSSELINVYRWCFDDNGLMWIKMIQDESIFCLCWCITTGY